MMAFARHQRLLTNRSEPVGDADAIPRDDRLRCTPAKLANGRCGKRNPLVGAHRAIGFNDPGYETTRDEDWISDHRLTLRG
jgi:hypothetical protein